MLRQKRRRPARLKIIFLIIATELMGLAALDPSTNMVRAGGLEPPRGYPQRIFVPASAFAAPASREASQGSWSGLSLHPAPGPAPSPGLAPGFRCCPSSLYTFPFPGLARDCRREVSPSLGSSASAVSRGALKSLQVRCVCHSATPAWRESYTHVAGSRQGDGAAVLAICGFVHCTTTGAAS